jgi:hypothetical protein
MDWKARKNQRQMTDDENITPGSEEPEVTEQKDEEAEDVAKLRKELKLLGGLWTIE